ncbi:MAG: cache domain-containing protein [Alphaproteobacteria bacterium]|nr:cache domain-containing protein [Alphaproteobacteria bacterium]
MALFWRIWASVIFVNLLVLSLYVGLSAIQFGNINSGLVGERLAVLAGRTAAPFEAAAKIGLPLSTVRNANALLERARQTDEAIRAIHVFDASGRVVHSTAAKAPALISPEAMLARKTSGNAPWYRETSKGFLSSINIAYADAGSAGGILIVYPGSGSLTRVLAMTTELSFAALIVLLGTAAISSILLRVALGKQISLFEKIEHDVGSFEKAAWRTAAGQTWAVAEDEGGELLDQLEKTEDQYRAAGKRLATVREGGK